MSQGAPRWGRRSGFEPRADIALPERTPRGSAASSKVSQRTQRSVAWNAARDHRFVEGNSEETTRCYSERRHSPTTIAIHYWQNNEQAPLCPVERGKGGTALSRGAPRWGQRSGFKPRADIAAPQGKPRGSTTLPKVSQGRQRFVARNAAKEHRFVKGVATTGHRLAMGNTTREHDLAMGSALPPCRGERGKGISRGLRQIARGLRRIPWGVQRIARGLW